MTRMTKDEARAFLEWNEDAAGGLSRMDGAYTITRVRSGFELRYRGTLLHTGLNVEECRVESDRHRGLR